MSNYKTCRDCLFFGEGNYCKYFLKVISDSEVLRAKKAFADKFCYHYSDKREVKNEHSNR